MHFTYQFLTNFAKINTNASLATSLNKFHISIKIHKY